MAYRKLFFAAVLFFLLTNFAHAGVVFGPAYGTPNPSDNNLSAIFTDGSSISFTNLGGAYDCHQSSYSGQGYAGYQSVCRYSSGDVQYSGAGGFTWTGTVVNGSDLYWWADGPGYELTDTTLVLDFAGPWDGQTIRGVYFSETGNYTSPWAQLSSVTTPEPASSALLLLGLPTVIGYRWRRRRTKQ